MFIDRLNAFVWTCAIEIPIYAWWMRGYVASGWTLVVIAFCLQLATQPLLWEFTARTAGDRADLLLAEFIVVVVEATMLYAAIRWQGRSQPRVGTVLWVAAVANSTSLACGSLLNMWVYA